MKTWTNYKNHVKAISPEDKKSMEDIENLADIIGGAIVIFTPQLRLILPPIKKVLSSSFLKSYIYGIY